MAAESKLIVRRFVLVALIFPVVITLIGVVIQLLALPELPATVAVHWNASGEADGFAPAAVVPVSTLSFGLGVPAILALMALPALRRGDQGPTYRFMGSTASWVSVLVVMLFTWTLLMQRGAEGADDAAGVGVALVASLVAATAVGIVAWFVQPHADVIRTGSHAPTEMTLGPSEQVAWVRTATMAKPVMWVLWGVSLLMVGAGAIAVSADAGASGWTLIGVGLVLVLTVGATTTFRVVVNTAGLTVRSVWGVPRFRVALGDVAGVEVADVSPIGEFGGWGVRAAPGRLGVVLRTGEAIDVTRQDGRHLVVTAEDAARGAALLVALSERSRSTSDG